MDLDNVNDGMCNFPPGRIKRKPKGSNNNNNKKNKSYDGNGSWITLSWLQM